jgi:hypothetical protein
MSDASRFGATPEQNQTIDLLFHAAGDLVRTVISGLSAPAQSALAQEIQAGLTIGLFLELHPAKRLSCFIKPPDGEARVLFRLDTEDPTGGGAAGDQPMA